MSQAIDRHNVVTNAQIALVALGSNATSTYGSANKTILAAIEIIARDFGVIRDVSRLYSTPCFPAGAGPDYVNAALALETHDLPALILQKFHRIERQFGRERTERWGDRTLDIDLLSWGAEVLPNNETYEKWRAMPADIQRMRAPEELVLPHPRMQDRAFVLVPLAEIAPDWRHPVLDRTMRELADALKPADVADIRPLDA